MDEFFPLSYSCASGEWSVSDFPWLVGKEVPVKFQRWDGHAFCQLIDLIFIDLPTWNKNPACQEGGLQPCLGRCVCFEMQRTPPLLP